MRNESQWVPKHIVIVSRVPNALLRFVPTGVTDVVIIQRLGGAALG
jgi:hypothetical protein